MDTLFREDDTMLARLTDYLREYPPRLYEILGSVCELYRADPDDMNKSTLVHPRLMFCFIAKHWGGFPNAEIASVIDINGFEVAKFARRLENRTASEGLLRDDLDLLAVSLAEKVMLRRRRSCI
jgi:hypothetical protein